MNEPTESNFSGRLNERPGAQQVLTRPFSGWGPLLGRPRLPSLSNIFAFFSLLLFYVSSRFLSAVCIGRRTLCGMQWSPRAFGRRSITLQVTHTHKMGGPVEERWICAVVVALARYHPAHQPVLKNLISISVLFGFLFHSQNEFDVFGEKERNKISGTIRRNSTIC